MTAPLIVAGVSGQAQTQTSTAAAPVQHGARKGRLKQGVTGGVFAPQGQALACAGGYRVTGRWAFASGCEHCAWLLGGCMVLTDGTPRMLANGKPDFGNRWRTLIGSATLPQAHHRRLRKRYFRRVFRRVFMTRETRIGADFET